MNLKVSHLENGSPMKINCPHCNNEVEIDDSYTKTYMQDCLSCGQEFKVQIGDVPDTESEEFVIEEPDPPKPIQKASVPKIPEGWVCLKCEMVGKPKSQGGGAKFLALGWFVCLPVAAALSDQLERMENDGSSGFLVVIVGVSAALIGFYGLVGSLVHALIVGFHKRTSSCFNCGNSDLIPLRSPKGFEIAEKHGFKF